MGLEALLADRSNRSEPCKLGRVIAALEEPYRGALLNLLAVSYVDGGESDTEIANRLKAAEIPTSTPTVNRHRRGICGCPKSEEVVR